MTLRDRFGGSLKSSSVQLSLAAFNFFLTALQMPFQGRKLSEEEYMYVYLYCEG